MTKNGERGGKAFQVASSSTKVMSCVVDTEGFRQQALLALLRVKNESIASFELFLVIHNSPIRDTTGTRKASLSSQSILIQFGLEVAGDDKVRLCFFAVLRDADRSLIKTQSVD